MKMGLVDDELSWELVNEDVLLLGELDLAEPGIRDRIERALAIVAGNTTEVPNTVVYRDGRVLHGIAHRGGRFESFYPIGEKSIRAVLRAID